MRLVKNSFYLSLIFLLVSCFGPVKELKYQIEDSRDDPSLFIDNPVDLAEIKNNFDINIVWSTNLSGDAKRNLTMVLHDDFLYYASYDGRISAIHLKKKELSWTLSTGSLITAGLESSNNKIFYIDYEGYLVALSLSGKIEWKTFVGEVFSPPLSLEKSVIIKTSNNKFVSFNLIDGSINWEYQVPNSPLPTRSWGEISFSNNIIYAGVSTGKVIALNSENGLLIWETTFSSPKGVSEIERSNDTTSKVVIDDFVVYAVSSNGNISAILKADGSIIWKRPLSSFQGLVADSEGIYVTHNSGSIYRLDKNTEKVLWRNADLLGRDVSRCFLYKNFIVVTDYQGYIHFLDKSNGEIKSRIKIADELILPPKVSRETENLFLISISGELYELSIAPNSTGSNIDGLNFNNDIQKNESSDNQEDSSLLDSLFFWE